MTKGFDVHDKGDLEQSLAHWKRELAQREVKLNNRERLVANAQKQKQSAQAVVKRRRTQLDALRDPSPRLAALHYALSFVGTTESPAGSNRGKQVSAFQRPFGIDGQPWCGAFDGFVLLHCGVHVTPRIVYTPYIYEDAVAHRNGLNGVVWHDGWAGKEVRSGHTFDLVLFDFGTPGGIKHVGALREAWKGGGPLKTIEGNTSFGNAGSQDNGGAVALRTRDISLVHSIVRVDWPS